MSALCWFRRDRTVYGCGNCRLTFKSETAREAHLDEFGVCPQVTFERSMQLSWADVDTLRGAGLNDMAHLAEWYLTRRSWRTLWRKPKRGDTAA